MASGRPVLFIAATLLGISLFCGLGVWQLQRLQWKNNLIEQVEARRKAAPVAAPGPDAWAAMTSPKDAYRRVYASGTYLNDRETLVQASTEHGPGFWVMTPLVTGQGYTILINRGFVPPEKRDAAARTAGQIKGVTTVTGLLRITEPKGRFLRANDAAAARWYARDVAAIAAARHLGETAPYFIDADNVPGLDNAPEGGLTIVSFPNNHLSYALTWFGLAALLAVRTVNFLCEERRRRKMTSDPTLKS